MVISPARRPRPKPADIIVEGRRHLICKTVHEWHAMASVDGRVSQGRLLVIDDDRLCALAIKRTLNVDYHVVCTASGAAALKMLAAGERYDLILCDLMMPGVTGMDFHVQLQKLYPDQANRIIFLTGGACTDRARHFLDEVPNLIVEKPISGAQLLALINARLR